MCYATKASHTLLSMHFCRPASAAVTPLFAQVLEFTAFRERLAASHTRAVARAEAAIAAVRAAAGAGEGQGQAAADVLRTAALDAAKGLPVEELPTTGQRCASMGPLPRQLCACMPTHTVLYAAFVPLRSASPMRTLCNCIHHVMYDPPSWDCRLMSVQLGPCRPPHMAAAGHRGPGRGAPRVVALPRAGGRPRARLRKVNRKHGAQV